MKIYLQLQNFSRFPRFSSIDGFGEEVLNNVSQNCCQLIEIVQLPITENFQMNYRREMKLSNCSCSDFTHSSITEPLDSNQSRCLRLPQSQVAIRWLFFYLVPVDWLLYICCGFLLTSFLDPRSFNLKSYSLVCESLFRLVRHETWLMISKLSSGGTII